MGLSVALQPDGKIIIGGWAMVAGNIDFAAVRVTADGSLDNGFGVGGKVITPIGTHVDYASSIVLQSDGKILLGGFSSNGTNNDFAMVRYNTDGTLDNGF